MPRMNFSPSTRRLIADRAGHQCSFPTCNHRTTGPGSEGDEVSGSGVAAHIYAAAASGPRGQGGLTPDELAQPENCIWLCSDHARLVDNHRGTAFPPETLLSYKTLHEARVVREVQGLYSPIGWLHELTISENPLFVSGQKIRFAKLNLVFGNNSAGKTALTEWVAGCFDTSSLARWRGRRSPAVHVRLSFLNPELHDIELKVEADSKLEYRVNGRDIPFNPMGLRIIRLGSVQFAGDDDLLLLSNALNLPPVVVRNLAHEIHSFPHARVRNLQFKIDSEDGLTQLYADVDGTVPGLPLRLLSGRETESIFMEFATAAARVSGRYTPTLLILDGCPLILFDGIFDFYSHHLLDPDNQFQTIMCIPSRNLDLDSLRWKGWEVMRTSGRIPQIVVTQELRTT